MSMNLSTCRLTLLFFLTAGAWPGAVRAQLRPAEITQAQATELPYRESGKITVQFGDNYYFGTATYVHRYTGLTAGHILYDPKKGFAVNPSFQPGLYENEPVTQPLGFFAVLAGYQSAAQVDPNSDPAFAQDMGYFLLLDPSPLDEWAAFSANPDLLTVAGSEFLAFGYAAQSFTGDKLASVVTGRPYNLDLTGLYETSAYYTEEGMSGGPVYLTESGTMAIGAVNVAGDDPPEQALSAARAITPDVAPLLIDSEYTHGIIIGAVITGPTTVQAGTTSIYRTGLKFKDGQTEGAGLPRRYEEIELIPQGSAKHYVTVTKFLPERFDVKFDGSLRAGTQVILRMFRDTAAPTAQAPLQTLTVTIQ